MNGLKNVSKVVMTVCAVSALILGGISPSSFAWGSRDDTPDTAVLVNIDNSGVSNVEMEAIKLALISRLAEAGQGRHIRNARLEFLSMISGKTVWVGSFKDLGDGERVNQLLKKIERDPVGCAGLESSMKRVETRLKYLETQGFQHVHVLFFSPLIDTDLPCNHTKPITLPQLPIEMNFDQVFQRKVLDSLVFYAVAPEQEPQWADVLEETAQYLRGAGKKFAMLGEEESISTITGRKITWLQHD